MTNDNRATPDHCEATQYSDQMVCSRCVLTWDINDSDPPDCKPKSPKCRWCGAEIGIYNCFCTGLADR